MLHLDPPDGQVVYCCVVCVGQVGRLHFNAKYFSVIVNKVAVVKHTK